MVSLSDVLPTTAPAAVGNPGLPTHNDQHPPIHFQSRRPHRAFHRPTTTSTTTPVGSNPVGTWHRLVVGTPLYDNPRRQLTCTFDDDEFNGNSLDAREVGCAGETATSGYTDPGTTQAVFVASIAQTTCRWLMGPLNLTVRKETSPFACPVGPRKLFPNELHERHGLYPTSSLLHTGLRNLRSPSENSPSLGDPRSPRNALALCRPMRPAYGPSWPRVPARSILRSFYIASSLRSTFRTHPLHNAAVPMIPT